MFLDRPGPMLAIGLAIGSAIGAFAGIAFDLPSIWLSVTTMVGGVFGAGLFVTLSQYKA